jgi:ADP-heptose:LPS heptosyltransferase
MELAGLGDNVHLLPALWLVRRRWPEASLHVMVNAHVADLFKLAPWVDRIWAYPSRPKPRLRDNLRWASQLRRERFDVVVNTTGSDRSSLFTWATRAPVRIGRRPSDGGPYGWRLLFTGVMDYPFYGEPMFRQKFECLKQAGCAGDEPEFHIDIDPALRRAAGITAEDEQRYIHLSPFTTADARELPPAQIAELVRRVRAEFPQLRWVVSCADTERERSKLKTLLAHFDDPPWKVFAGDLGVPSLAAVIQASAANLSGDTGSLHVAMMTRAPAVAWFRAHKGQKEWIPHGPQYRVLIAEGGPPDALHGIETQAIVDALRDVLRSGEAA